MSRGISLAEFIQVHRATARDAFTANPGSAFLLLERLSPALDVKKRFLTTLMQADDSLDLDTAEAEDLLVFALPGAGRSQPAITLGRADDGDIQLDDAAVSKLHLRFVYDANTGTHAVFDPGSQNGTKLDGIALDPNIGYPLKDGAALEIAERFRAHFVSAGSLFARLRRELARSEAATSAAVSGSSSSGLLAGKVAVITGAGRGLGRAYALRFAEEGCKVVVNDNGAAPDGTGRDASVAPSVVAEIERAGGVAVASQHDVSSPAEVEALFRLASEHFGPVDVLVCSAGGLHLGSSILDAEDEVWERLMAINARGTFLCLRAAARQMVEQKRAGRIIITSSLVAMTGNPGVAPYAASKAAVCGLSLTAALELAPHDINVNVITPMAWTRLTNLVPAFAAIPDAEEVLSPRYVADVVLFLASDLSAGITGQVIDVGGPQVSFHRTQQTAPTKAGDGRWTAQELRRRWDELTKGQAAD